MASSDFFKTGDVTAIGAVVLATRGDYVLCALPGRADPFVTWWVSAQGETLSGVYVRELGDGMRSLMERSAAQVA